MPVKSRTVKDLFYTVANMLYSYAHGKQMAYFAVAYHLQLMNLCLNFQGCALGTQLEIQAGTC